MATPEIDELVRQHRQATAAQRRMVAWRNREAVIHSDQPAPAWNERALTAWDRHRVASEEALTRLARLDRLDLAAALRLEASSLAHLAWCRIADMNIPRAEERLRNDRRVVRTALAR